ncbi:hypothetical protein [Rhodoferax sp.]|uniref:hypothetical protein n=1 Tax=Rhodoferax sp. TaxID=50421 RepID=UPI00261986B8|nr:hypothetical protein [Rhodoferax sp.]MDD2918888.1 hypothetical protein [Rhodoferax sp.]
MGEDETKTNAFLSFSIGEERVTDSHRALLAAIDAKLCQLKGPVPFTIRDEIDLHKHVLQYIDSCISQISTMQKLMGLPRLEFPVHHDLLRLFRDHNHHVGYLAFVPLASTKGAPDFFAWPTLQMIDAVKQKHKKWVAAVPQTTLSELIYLNHAYVLSVIEGEKQKFQSNGVPLFTIRKEYPMGVIYFGTSLADTNDEKN